jgi:hypothetical protein
MAGTHRLFVLSFGSRPVLAAWASAVYQVLSNCDSPISSY